MSKMSTKLFQEILSEMNYDPLDAEVAVAKKAIELAELAEKNSDKAMFYNLAHKINSRLNNKLHADRKAIDIEVSSDQIELPQIILNRVVEDESAENKETKKDVLH